MCVNLDKRVDKLSTGNAEYRSIKTISLIYSLSHLLLFPVLVVPDIKHTEEAFNVNLFLHFRKKYYAVEEK